MVGSKIDKTEPVAQSFKRPRIHSNYQTFLHDTIQVLCGTREPKFQYEKQLRLCQFKIWLLGYGNECDSVRNGGMIYAAAKINWKMQRLQKRFPSESQGSLLRRIMSFSEYQSLFDFAFVYPQTMYDLSNCLPFQIIHKEIVQNEVHTYGLNCLTFWRIRIAKTEGLRSAVNYAYNAYSATRAYELEENKETAYLSKETIKTEHEVREHRESFLFVAYGFAREMKKFAPTAPEMVELLDKQVKNPDFFRNYFGRCQSVHSLLKIKDLPAGTIKSWTGVDNIPLDEIPPIPKEEQDWLGVKDSKRRSAEQTAKALRQKPRP